MSKNFWLKLNKPILALAPMAGFTDSSFRQICKKYGADVVYSEMASTTALYYQQQRKIDATLRLLRFNVSKETPYVIQLFGSNPDHFAQATRFITREVKPAGIDINFGCPVGKIIKQGAGADLMKDLDKAYQVIKSVINNTDLPVSVKIRTKSGQVSAIDFLRKISDLPVAAVMIHARTLSQGFSGELDYQIVKEARKYFRGVILVNGGVTDLESARKALDESQADGLGVARGALGRPWIFREIKKNKKIDLDLKSISKIILRQAKSVHKKKGQGGIVELRKHLCWYTQGIEGAKKLREQLVRVETLQDIKKVLKIK